MSQEAVAVVGLGLMGGSLARELAARGYGVLGFDHDAATVRAAREAGGAAHALPAPAAAGLGSARLLVLAVPVAAAPTLLASLLPHLHPDCVVTDLGSTKREIGEEHPFVVGAAGVQRYFTVMTECAMASKLRAGAK